MADEKKDDEKKPSKSAKMYGKGPKISAAPEKGDTNKSGHQEEAKKDADKTAGKPETKADMKSGGEAAADVMAGTDGIETTHVESNEREAMFGRQKGEHEAMHGRHEKEHILRATGHHTEDMKAMNDRHVMEKRTMHTRHEREMKDMNARHEGAKDGTGPDAGIKKEKVGNAGTNKE